MGEVIGIEDIFKLLSLNQGGLKGIPSKSQRYLFLNQAEGQILAAKAKRLAEALNPYYDRVCVGSLEDPGQDGPIFSAHVQTGGVILAAGGSERFGRPKQLLDWDGKPFIVRVVETAQAAGLKPVIVITGVDHDAIKAVLYDLAVEVIHNPNWEAGQSTSMKLGIESLPERCENVVFLLSDQPQISPLLIRSLIEHQSQRLSPIVAPLAGGRRANPVLFNRETFDALMQVSGDQGGRAVFNQFQIDWLPWIDSRINIDVDEPGDEKRLREAYFG
jgi:molybdenum cofactor cytidylyltransferase